MIKLVFPGNMHVEIRPEHDSDHMNLIFYEMHYHVEDDDSEGVWYVDFKPAYTMGMTMEQAVSLAANIADQAGLTITEAQLPHSALTEQPRPATSDTR